MLLLSIKPSCFRAAANLHLFLASLEDYELPHGFTSCTEPTSFHTAWLAVDAPANWKESALGMWAKLFVNDFAIIY